MSSQKWIAYLYKGNDDTHSFIHSFKVEWFWNTSCNTNAVICVAAAHTLQAAESAAHSKMLNHKSVGFYATV